MFSTLCVFFHSFCSSQVHFLAKNLSHVLMYVGSYSRVKFKFFILLLFFQGCITVCFSDYSTVTLPLSSSSKYLVYLTFCLTQFRSLYFSGVLVHVCYLLLLLYSLCIYASLCFIVLFLVSYVHIQVSIVFFGYFSILF